VRRSAVGLGLAGALWAAAALCQVSGSVALLSDYRYRGVSLTADRPALQASIVYDDTSGAYAGAFASNVRLASGASLEGVAFAGYARRLGPVDADVGVSGTWFSGGAAYDYGEMHAGVAFEGLAARISYAPTYFGDRRGSWYLEVNDTHALAGPFSVFGHAGLLRRRADGYGAYETAATIVDTRVGVVAAFDVASVRLEWVNISTLAYAYPVVGSKRRSNIVLSITRTF
jgi:uncharacterized protein (TIGR02001 family)